MARPLAGGSEVGRVGRVGRVRRVGALDEEDSKDESDERAGTVTDGRGGMADSQGSNRQSPGVLDKTHWPAGTEDSSTKGSVMTKPIALVFLFILAFST